MAIQSASAVVALTGGITPQPIVLANGPGGLTPQNSTVVAAVLFNVTPYIAEISGMDGTTGTTYLAPGCAQLFGIQDGVTFAISGWINPIAVAPPATPVILLTYATQSADELADIPVGNLGIQGAVTGIIGAVTLSPGTTVGVTAPTGGLAIQGGTGTPVGVSAPTGGLPIQGGTGTAVGISAPTGGLPIQGGTGTAVGISAPTGGLPITGPGGAGSNLPTLTGIAGTVVTRPVTATSLSYTGSAGSYLTGTVTAAYRFLAFTTTTPSVVTVVGQTTGWYYGTYVACGANTPVVLPIDSGLDTTYTITVTTATGTGTLASLYACATPPLVPPPQAELLSVYNTSVSGTGTWVDLGLTPGGNQVLTLLSLEYFAASTTASTSGSVASITLETLGGTAIIYKFAFGEGGAFNGSQLTFGDAGLAISNTYDIKMSGQATGSAAAFAQLAAVYTLQ